jgi:hypothetical protein
VSEIFYLLGFICRLSHRTGTSDNYQIESEPLTFFATKGEIKNNNKATVSELMYFSFHLMSTTVAI